MRRHQEGLLIAGATNPRRIILRGDDEVCLLDHAILVGLVVMDQRSSAPGTASQVTSRRQAVPTAPEPDTLHNSLNIGLTADFYAAPIPRA